MEKFRIQIPNIAKEFRRVGVYPDEILSSRLDKAFDEPTYYTFKVEFYSDRTENLTTETNFDLIPQPLFLTYTEDSINRSVKDPNNAEFYLYPRTEYSTRQYLRDNNEFIREDMLNTFIAQWNDLQDNFQWQFQSVSGINSVMKVNPAFGKRIPSDARITFTMLESLDQRVTHLLNLYRKIAWDDTYQRWVLPDMMRFFRIKIYITELRTFHRSNFSYIEPGEINNDMDMMLYALVDTMPTYVLELERCEFDIESFNFLPDSLSVSDTTEQRSIEFSVKVGNISERYINPILNYFWHDWLINGFTRSSEILNPLNVFSDDESASGLEPGGQSNLLGAVNYSQNLLIPGDFLSHAPNTPYNEMKDDKRMLGYLGPGPDGIWGPNPDNNDEDDADYIGINPTDPNTWFGNAFKYGKAVVKNFVKDKVSEVKLANIGGRNITFAEAIGALQSKNIFAVFGLARQAMNETIGRSLPSDELSGNPDTKLTGKLDYPRPSSLLESEIDRQFRIFLENIISSATSTGNTNSELAEAANLVLNDNGIWEKIKDYSKATNILYEKFGEENIPNLIRNPNALKEIYDSTDYVVKEVERGIIYEGIPSSVSTSRQIEDEGGKIIRPSIGNISPLVEGEINRGILGSINRNIDTEEVERSSPSSQIGNNAGAELQRGESNPDLILETGENINPSILLSDKISESISRGSLEKSRFIEGESAIPDPGSQLSNSISEGGIIDGGTSKSNISWSGMPRPEPGEAVDGDPIDEINKIPRPPIK